MTIEADTAMASTETHDGTICERIAALKPAGQLLPGTYVP
jgi:hypothetical protein